MFYVKVEHICKSFSFRHVLRDISFTLRDGDCLVITGRNGSGKSTFLKILCGLLGADSGRVIFESDAGRLDRETSRRYTGLVSPEVMLYEELTALENLEFLGAVGGTKFSHQELRVRLKQVGLDKRENDRLGFYSTGMMQRVKFAFALLNRPKLLLLDEPNANLDQSGLELMEKMINQQKETGILILATNQPEQVKYGSQTFNLDQ